MKKLFIIASLILIPGLLFFYFSADRTPRIADSRPAAPAPPSPQDGQGTAVVIPSEPVSVSSPGTWKLVYTVGPKGILPGGGIAFHIPPFWGWTPPQNHDPAAAGYSSASCSNKSIELSVTANPELSHVLVTAPKAGLTAGDTVTVIYGDTQEGRYPGAAARSDRYAEQGERFVIKVDGDGDRQYYPIADPPRIDIRPGPAARLVVTAPSLVEQNGRFTLTTAAVDSAENWAGPYNENLIIESFPPGVRLLSRETRAGAVLTTCALPAPGNYYFSVQSDGRSLSGRSNPVRCLPARPPLNLYWADLHGHSALSDGTGTPEDYFHYARYVSRLDAAALTDHDAWGFDPLDQNPSLWKRIQQTANRLNEPGEFVTVAGYEWTHWTYGHKHVLFFSRPAPLLSWRAPGSSTPDELWKSLSGLKALSVAHHVGGGPIATDWRFHSPDFEPVVEICSIHGNSERWGAPACIYSPRKGAFVQDALARGYRLGFIGGGDTHNGHPGRGDPLAVTGGLMAFYAEELSRDSLWAAMKDRRVYATSGDRIILEFNISGKPMGAVVQNARSPMREIHFMVLGTSRLKLVEIIKNNTVFKRWSDAPRFFEQAASDEAGTEPGDYYYLRILQQNGQMAWSSPVWFE